MPLQAGQYGYWTHTTGETDWAMPLRVLACPVIDTTGRPRQGWASIEFALSAGDAPGDYRATVPVDRIRPAVGTEIADCAETFGLAA